MAYNVIEVSQHVINYSIRKNKPVTNLKLQKILYYIQAAFLVEYNKECFEEEIQHWRHGPVIPKIYSNYKKYMDRNITDIQEGYDEMYLDEDAKISIRKNIYNEDNFIREHLELINKVIDSYIDMDPWDMVDKTHEEKPWIDTESNDIISKSSIKEFFKENHERIYGGLE